MAKVLTGIDRVINLLQREAEKQSAKASGSADAYNNSSLEIPADITRDQWDARCFVENALALDMKKQCLQSIKALKNFEKYRKAIEDIKESLPPKPKLALIKNIKEIVDSIK